MSEIFVTLRTRAISLVTHIKRKLSGTKIKLLVSQNQEVRPEDILGESSAAAGFITIPLASALGVSRQQAAQFLKKRLGQNIYAGELLAQRSGGVLGFINKTVVASVDGVLDYYDVHSGTLRIKFLPKNERVLSGVYGVIDRIDPPKGEVTIRTLATIIFGIVGSGKERSGILKVLNSPHGLISSKQLDGLAAGSIVVGGSFIFTDALQKALHSKISGIVTGGIDARDLKGMRAGIIDPKNTSTSDVGISLMVTEGFGTVAMGKDIFQVLKQHDQTYATLFGNRAYLLLPSTDPSSMIYIRKVRLPIKELVTVPTFSDRLHPGVKVRIIAQELFAVQGVVETIDATETLLPSGMKAILATVVSSLGKLRIPTANLEIIA